MTFGKRLRGLRKSAGRSLRELSSQLGVDPAYLSRVEVGKVPPSDALVRAVGRILAGNTEELHVLAGRIPPSWKRVIEKAPERSIERLRGAIADSVAEPPAPYGAAVVAFGGTRAIEDDRFPFETLSDIAEVESWRKEIHRPVYHLHKWWAQRLGSVFRAILIGAFAPKGSSVLEMFYQPTRLPGAVIFDPLMGSGTTLGEALKLGARAIGRDINPVASFAVQNALARYDRTRVIETFEAMRQDVARVLRRYYRAQLPSGREVDVLYYFWVKFVPCPACRKCVDLFSSYVFAQHAYPSKYPEAKAVCPACGGINSVRYDAAQARCKCCRQEFSSVAGPARGTKATCISCGESFGILNVSRKQGHPPEHRMYAKMVLKADGQKEYLPIEEFDLDLYESAKRELARRRHAYPVVEIAPGYNTDQVLNYGYRYWHQMFNDRQLLCLSILADRIRSIADDDLRSLFTCLFSGCLEFNNMFASFKGEGTGAVRHMFSHHILKPERTPLEANVWGTPRSSGAFSTLFESRLLRALDYKEHPFELLVRPKKGRLAGEKVFGLSSPIGHDIADSWATFERGTSLYLSCGDSASTDLPDGSVDAVVTDPPFFDNVNYSQLADFFHVWQRHMLGARGLRSNGTTRSTMEVQHHDPRTFSERLSGIWRESARVLRREGILVFTYHHSRPEGWVAVLDAILGGGFGIVAAHPIKSEMSVAAPKAQAKEPIDLDVILVCRKGGTLNLTEERMRSVIARSAEISGWQIGRLNDVGRRLSRNDVRVVVMAQVIRHVSLASNWEALRTKMGDQADGIDRLIERLYLAQRLGKRRTPEPEQLALLGFPQREFSGESNVSAR